MGPANDSPNDKSLENYLPRTSTIEHERREHSTQFELCQPKTVFTACTTDPLKLFERGVPIILFYNTRSAPAGYR